MIPLARPAIGPAEEDAARRVLRSAMLVQGAEVEAFEASLAERCARRHAIAVSSGTSALELALAALDVGPDDDVLCPNVTWPSPANAAALRGARVIPVDVDPEEWNSGPTEFARTRSPGTRVAVVIHQFGLPARANEIRRVLPGVRIVEDAACALGSRIGGSPCGGVGDVACISFHPRKIVTTGEGGACLTDDDGLAARLRALRNHGQEAPGKFGLPAGNHRLTELAAAIGRAQLERLDGFVARRALRAARYREALPALRWPRVPPTGEATHQTLAAALPEGATASDRDHVIASLRGAGVASGILSYALSRLPAFARGTAFARAAGENFRVSESLVDRGLALPLYDAMTDTEQDAVLAAAHRALSVVGQT